MRVLLINGSQKTNGDTHQSLMTVETLMKAKGVEADIFHIGSQMIRGCIECDACRATNYCTFQNDPCNPLIDAIKEVDGIVIGSPVYFGGPSGSVCSLLDRVFYATSHSNPLFAGKPAAALVNCNVTGAAEALDHINNYFSYSQMPIVSCINWTVDLMPDNDAETEVFEKQSIKNMVENMYMLIKMKTSLK